MTRIGRDQVRELLEERRLDAILSLVDEGRPVLRRLKAFLLSEHDLLRERAAEATGIVAGRLHESRPEHVRNLLRALIWTLTDEAGMTGRGSPDAIGWIIHEIPEIIPEFAPILVTFLDNEEVVLGDEILDAGLLASLGRLGCDDVEMSDEGLVRMAGLMRDPRPRLRGTAAWAAGRLELGALRDALEGLRGDQDVFPLYLDGALTRPTVGQVAEEAFARLETARSGTA